MARTDTLGHFLTDVADAIREKKGTSETITASDFDTEIENLPSGGSDLDWSAIGYESEPPAIQDGYDYAVQIKNNWVEGTSAFNNKFYYDFQLMYLPLIDTSNIQDWGNAFNNCTGLVSVPLLNTSKATTLGKTFYSCQSLRTVPLLDISNVTWMLSTFSYCRSLKSIPQFNTANVTNFQETFSSCSALETVPILNTSKATTMSNMFSGCGNLTDTSIDNILQMCIGATSYSGTKTLKQLGFSATNYPTTRIEALSHYQDFINAGWTIGY